MAPQSKSGKRKVQKQQLRRIAKKNLQVDARVVAESMEIIGYARKLGIKSSGLTVRGVSESHLKVRGPAPQTL